MENSGFFNYLRLKLLYSKSITEEDWNLFVSTYEPNVSIHQMPEEAEKVMHNLHLKIIAENDVYCTPDDLFYVMAILVKNALDRYHEKKGSYKIDTTIPLSEDDMQFVYEERIPIREFTETEFKLIKVVVRRRLERVVEGFAKVDINEYRKPFPMQ